MARVKSGQISETKQGWPRLELGWEIPKEVQGYNTRTGNGKLLLNISRPETPQPLTS